MTWDPHREDEARWIEAMRQRHARGQQYVCGLADVLRTIEERDEARRWLRELTAIIHRDGGHHTERVGMAQAVDDAHKAWASVVSERDEARQHLAAGRSKRKRWARYRRQRDEARAEVARLRAALERIAQGFDSVNGAAARMVDGYYKGLAESALGVSK